MSAVLVLNSSNVTGNINSTYTYKFINGSYAIPEGSEICVSSAVIPYSFFNVSAQVYNNATFSYNYPNNAGGFTTYTIILPNGFYLLSNIVQYIQNYMISLNQYLIRGTSNIYFIDLVSNSTYYTNTLFLYQVPTAANLATLYPGATAPVGFVFPTISRMPTFTVLSTSAPFGSLIGFLPGTYGPSPNPPGGTTYSYNTNGNTVPNATPVNSLVLNCNLVNNLVTMPSNIMDSMPINATFGSNITYNATFEKWVPLTPGRYSNLIVNLLDQNLNPVVCNDPNILITLLLRSPKKNVLKIY